MLAVANNPWFKFIFTSHVTSIAIWFHLPKHKPVNDSGQLPKVFSLLLESHIIAVLGKLWQTSVT